MPVVNQQFILQIILLLCGVILLLGLISFFRTRRLENRISRYIVDIEKKSPTYFDKLEEILFIFLKNISKFLSRISFIKKWGDSYIDLTVRDKSRQGLDFLSLKFLSGFLFFISFLLSALLLGNNVIWWECLIIILLGFILPDIFFSISRRRRRRIIEKDFPLILTIMNNSFRSGRNIYQVVVNVQNEMDGPLQEEFDFIARDLTYGLSIEEAFARFANRVPLEEVKYLTTSLILLSKTGGAVEEIFEVIQENLLAREKLKQEMKSLTATATFLYRFLAVVPIFLVGAILLLNKDYFIILFKTWLGRELLLVMVIFYLLYLFIVKKLMKVEEL